DSPIPPSLSSASGCRIRKEGLAVARRSASWACTPSVKGKSELSRESRVEYKNLPLPGGEQERRPLKEGWATVHRIKLFILATALAVVPGLVTTVTTQSGALAAGRVTHIGVVVADMDAALREYVRVMGFPMPTINRYPIPVPDGRSADFKLATLYMPNFFIEVIQPVNNVGPYYEHLQSQGMSIQHVG